MLSAVIAGVETLPAVYYGRALAGLELGAASISLLASFVGTAAAYLLAFELCASKRWLRHVLCVAIAVSSVALQVVYFGIYREFSTLPTVSIVDFARQTPRYAWALFIDRLNVAVVLFAALLIYGLARAIALGSARPRRLGAPGLATLSGLVLVSAWSTRSPFMSFSQQAVWLVAKSSVGPGVVNAGWTPDRAKLPKQPARFPANVIIFRLEEVAAMATTLGRPELATTPSLAAFVDEHPHEAFKGRQHFSNSTATDVSVLSIYTGLSPAAPLDAHRHVPILWDYYSAAGYDTSVFMPFHLEWGDFRTRFNARPGEVHLNEIVDAGNSNRPIVYDNSINDSDVIAQALDYQQRRSWKEPFFQVVSLKMPHAIGEGARVNELHYDDWAGEPEDLHDYYNGIRHDDILIQQFIGQIPAKTREHTLMVFVSDHGTRLSARTDGVEELHRLDNYHQETTHVPFVVYVPDAIQEKLPPSLVRNLRTNLETRATSNIDMVPTLLGLTGIDRAGPRVEHDELLVGRDLTREIDPTEAIVQLNTGALRRWDREHFAMVMDNGERHYLFSMGRELLYDRTADPLELNNLAESAASSAMLARARALTAEVPELLRIQRKYRGANAGVSEAAARPPKEEKEQVTSVALRPAEPLLPRPIPQALNQPTSNAAVTERVLAEYEVPASAASGGTRVDIVSRAKDGAGDLEWRLKAGDAAVYVAHMPAAPGQRTSFAFRWRPDPSGGAPMIVQLVGSSPEQGFGVDVDIAERRGDDGARRDFEVLALEADPDGSQVSATYHLDRFQKRDCVTPGAGPCPDGFLVWGPYVGAKRHSTLSLRFDIQLACADSVVWMDLTADAGKVPLALSKRRRLPSAGARSLALYAEIEEDANGIEGRLNVQAPAGGQDCAVSVRDAVLTVSEAGQR